MEAFVDEFGRERVWVRREQRASSNDGRPSRAFLGLCLCVTRGASLATTPKSSKLATTTKQSREASSASMSNEMKSC